MNAAAAAAISTSHWHPSKQDNLPRQDTTTHTKSHARDRLYRTSSNIRPLDRLMELWLFIAPWDRLNRRFVLTPSTFARGQTLLAVAPYVHACVSVRYSLDKLNSWKRLWISIKLGRHGQGVSWWPWPSTSDQMLVVVRFQFSAVLSNTRTFYDTWQLRRAVAATRF